MEENSSSTVAKNYWLAVTKVIKPNFFSDYITNPHKRFETGFAANVGKDFWRQYSAAYISCRNSGGLILRAKIVDQNSVTIKQIYQTKQHRIDFIKQVNTTKFYENIDFDIVETEYSITELEKDNSIHTIVYAPKVIIQYLREDHYLPGIIIGDPLKNEPLLKLD